MLIQTPSLKDLRTLKFNDIHLLQLGQFMYFFQSSFLPPRFNNNFSQSNQFHSYNTFPGLPSTVLSYKH